MAGFSIAIVPLGRLDAAEIEAAAARAGKVWRQPFELRDALPVPQSSGDRGRGQHRAASLIGLARDEVAKLRPGRLVGAAEPGPAGLPRPEGFVFVTDVDLYTAQSEGVFAALLRSRQAAVLSIRRLREAFYRRPADPTRQRTRLVKELLRLAGRLAGAAECADPQCLLAPSRTVPDLDLKEERFCRACEQRLFEGRVQL